MHLFSTHGFFLIFVVSSFDKTAFPCFRVYESLWWEISSGVLIVFSSGKGYFSIRKMLEYLLVSVCIVFSVLGWSL